MSVFDVVSQACVDAMTPGDGWRFEALAEIIAIREHLRQNGGVPAGFDNLALQLLSYEKYGDEMPPDVEAEFDKLVGQFRKMIPVSANEFEMIMVRWGNEFGTPGFSNADCSMDWREFACFVNLAADAQKRDELTMFLADWAATDPGDDLPECSPAVMSDVFYDDIRQEESAPIWPWIVGGAALLGLGGWLFTRKG